MLKTYQIANSCHFVRMDNKERSGYMNALNYNIDQLAFYLHSFVCDAEDFFAPEYGNQEVLEYYYHLRFIKSRMDKMWRTDAHVVEWELVQLRIAHEIEMKRLMAL